MRATQDVVSGGVAILFAGGVLAAMATVPQAKYQAISPVLFPRVCAYALVVCGVILVLRGVRRGGEVAILPGLRGVGLITLAVVAFGVIAPNAGYLPAGAATVFISGLATREAKPLELAVFTVGLLAFSVMLFSFVLKVPMPIVSPFGVGF